MLVQYMYCMEQQSNHTILDSKCLKQQFSYFQNKHNFLATDFTENIYRLILEGLFIPSGLCQWFSQRMWRFSPAAVSNLPRQSFSSVVVLFQTSMLQRPLLPMRMASPGNHYFLCNSEILAIFLVNPFFVSMFILCCCIVCLIWVLKRNTIIALKSLEEEKSSDWHVGTYMYCMEQQSNHTILDSKCLKQQFSYFQNKHNFLCNRFHRKYLQTHFRRFVYSIRPLPVVFTAYVEVQPCSCSNLQRQSFSSVVVLFQTSMLQRPLLPMRMASPGNHYFLCNSEILAILFSEPFSSFPCSSYAVVLFALFGCLKGIPLLL